jgi:tRNA (adenine-N(1)-)-methyltransferase non-catalytic subunit
LDRIFFEAKLAIDCRIHETFLREYQVLPLRTHPEMNVKGYSGYVFSAIKIVEPEEFNIDN